MGIIDEDANFIVTIARYTWLPGGCSCSGTAGGRGPMQVTLNSGGGSSGCPTACAAPTCFTVVNQNCAGIDGTAIGTQVGDGIAGTRITYPQVVVRYSVGIGIVTSPAE